LNIFLQKSDGRGCPVAVDVNCRFQSLPGKPGPGPGFNQGC
jgi:hypothetical protein